MSAEALEHAPHAVVDAHTYVAHQFEDRAQQNESYIVGMWTFLVTEIMFFGALFLAYAVYRSQYPTEVTAASQELSVGLGFVNTLILLTSSLTMAFGVRASILKQKRMQLVYIGATILLAFGFMGVKTIEYGSKFEHHLFPGPNFQWPPAHHGGSHSGEAHGAGSAAAHGSGKAHGPSATVPTPQAVMAPAGAAPSTEQEAFIPRFTPDEITKGRVQLYIGLYFIMTGLHGLHVLIGILVLGAIWLMIAFDHPAIQDFIPIELAGLYWHFVDIVWIFLYPLLYLIHPKPFW